MLIAPRLKGIKTGGGALDADAQLAGAPSATVDAIALVLTEQAATALCADAAAVQFVADAFVHLKAIGCTSDAPLLDRAGVVNDGGVTGLDSTFITAAGQRFYDREPAVRALA